MKDKFQVIEEKIRKAEARLREDEEYVKTLHAEKRQMEDEEIIKAVRRSMAKDGDVRQALQILQSRNMGSEGEKEGADD